MTVLSCRGVSKSFMGVAALRDVSLGVAEGEILGIIGPNGSGKTTLFNILSGIERPDGGPVQLGGETVTHRPAPAIAGRGLVFQSFPLLPSMTALENVMAGGHQRAPTGRFGQVVGLPTVRRAEGEARRDALELLRDVGLGAHAGNYPEALSYGQTKRLELARALNIRPKVLLLDEPTAGMNDVQATEILDLVGRIKRRWNLTVVVIEHNVPVLSRFVDRLHVLDAGRTVTEGTPGAVVQDERVIEAYLGTGA